MMTSLELTIPLYSKVLKESNETVYEAVKQNLHATLEFLIKKFEPRIEVNLFQSEQTPFARINYLRKNNFNSNDENLSMSFGSG